MAKPCGSVPLLRICQWTQLGGGGKSVNLSVLEKCCILSVTIFYIFHPLDKDLVIGILTGFVHLLPFKIPWLFHDFP